MPWKSVHILKALQYPGWVVLFNSTVQLDYLDSYEGAIEKRGYPKEQRADLLNSFFPSTTFDYR